MINGISELREIVKKSLIEEFGSIELADKKMLAEAKKSANQYSERNYSGVVVRRMYSRPSVWTTFSVNVRGIGVTKTFSVSRKYLNRPTVYDDAQCLF